MTLAEILGLVIAAAGIFGLGTWGVIELRARRVFMPRSECGPMQAKVFKMEKEQAKVTALVMGQDNRISLLEQADKHQAEQMNELVVKPLERVVERLDGIAETQQKHGEVLAAHTEGQKALGRSFDELRDRVNRQGGTRDGG